MTLLCHAMPNACMATPSTVNEAVEQYAIDAKRRVQIGNESVEMYPMDELIRAANFLKAQEVAANPPAHFGLRMSKLVPPGAG